MNKLIFSAILTLGLAITTGVHAQEVDLSSRLDEQLNAADEPFQLTAYETAAGGSGGQWTVGAEVPLLTLYANHGASGSNSWFSGFDTAPGIRLNAAFEGDSGLGLRAHFFTFVTEGGRPREFFDVEMYDVEATNRLNLGNWDFLLSGGLRAGSIKFNDEFNGNAYGYTGVGMTAGAEARRSITDGLTLVAAARQTFLYGRMDSAAGGTRLGNALVPITELRLGVDYTMGFENGMIAVLGVGYEHQQYTSLSVTPNNIDPEDVSVALAGPVVSLMVRF